MTLREYDERAATLNQQAQQILADAKQAARDLTPEEDAEFTQACDERDAALQAAERIRTRESRLNAAPVAAPGAPTQTAGRRAVADTTRITDVKMALEDDPKKGFKSPRHFIQSVMDYGRTNRIPSNAEGLKVLQTAGSDEQSTFSDGYGGFLVPVGFSPDMLRIEPEDDPMAGRTTTLPMGTPRVEIPSRVDKNHSTSVSGGLTVTRRAEATEAASSRMQTEKVTLNAYSLFGVSFATEEILNDSPQSFAALIAAGFKDEMTSYMIDERLNGTGVGEHLGVNNSPCVIDIAKETGQAADTIVYENIIKMRARAWGYRNSVWMANHDCLPQLMLLNQSVGTGGTPVWQPSAREDHPDMLLGRPLILSEYMAAIGDVGDIGCYNWTQYLEGVYQPLQSAESVHVRFLAHERTFKFWLRNAGAPWWKSALTPKRGSTLSPFVRLAAR
jgi:HK97 family phage major capsid protein